MLFRVQMMMRLLGLSGRENRCVAEYLHVGAAGKAKTVSTPVVTLVVDPGRYRFTDFIKVDVPLLLLTYVVTLLVAPLIFPFHPS